MEEQERHADSDHHIPRVQSRTDQSCYSFMNCNITSNEINYNIGQNILETFSTIVSRQSEASILGDFRQIFFEYDLI